MYSLRQKTYGVFIRPYILFKDDKLVQRGDVYSVGPCPKTGDCQPYIAALGGYKEVERDGKETIQRDGEAWMLYNGEFYTSFTVAKEKVKEVMDILGYSKNDIMLGEIAPMDHIITPMA